MKKLILLLLLFSSCYEGRKVKNIHRPTKREIKKAMKYSTSEYRMPKSYIMYQNK